MGNELAATALAESVRVVGRESELARLEAFVSALPAGAQALIVRGPPRIGKTTLWLDGIERCSRPWPPPARPRSRSCTTRRCAARTR